MLMQRQMSGAILESLRGGGGMADYRIYHLTPEGRIGGPASLISASGNTSAVQCAVKLFGADRRMELWLGDLLVATLPSLTCAET